MTVKNLHDLFAMELSDIYSAEKQLMRALPKLAKAASDEWLARAFSGHLKETESQIKRLEKVMSLCDIKPKRKKCEAMEGLIAEGGEIIKDIEEGPLRDAALVSAAQKVEHYEISAYLSLLKLADQLGYRRALPLLEDTLDEEEGTDYKLSGLGDWILDRQAEHGAVAAA